MSNAATFLQQAVAVHSAIVETQSFVLKKASYALNKRSIFVGIFSVISDITRELEQQSEPVRGKKTKQNKKQAVFSIWTSIGVLLKTG